MQSTTRDGVTLNSEHMEVFDGFFKNELKKSLKKVKQQLKSEKVQGKNAPTEFTMERI